MTKSQRPDARRDYKHFPREYTDLLVAFERDGRVVLSYSTEREAIAARRDLYRFKTIAANTLTARPTDTQAAWITDTFNTCTLRVEQSHDGTSSCWLLILDSNPIVRAIRAGALKPPSELLGALVPASEASGGTDEHTRAAREAWLNTTSKCLATGIDGDYCRSAVQGEPKYCTHCTTPARGCRFPAACRSTIHGAPAFCECGETGDTHGTN